jgi:hypothetical protein
MKVKLNNNKTELTVNLDQAWIWVRLEDELGLTVSEAQDKIAAGSTKVITYSLWLASESPKDYKDWIKELTDFEVIEDYPKATDPEVSAAP